MKAIVCLPVDLFAGPMRTVHPADAHKQQARYTWLPIGCISCFLCVCGLVAAQDKLRHNNKTKSPRTLRINFAARFGL